MGYHISLKIILNPSYCSKTFATISLQILKVFLTCLLWFALGVPHRERAGEGGRVTNVRKRAGEGIKKTAPKTLWLNLLVISVYVCKRFSFASFLVLFACLKSKTKIMYVSFLSIFRLQLFFTAVCVFVLGLCLNPQAQAQGLTRNTSRCGADHFLKERLKRQNMSTDDYLSRMKKLIQANNPAAENRLAQEETLYTLPMVIHLIYYPDRSIGSTNGPLTDCHVHAAMEELNKTFGQTQDLELPEEFASVAAGDTRIRFQLATQDPEGNSTTGIVRHPIEGTLAELLREVPVRDNSLVSIHDELGRWNPTQYINIYVYPALLLGDVLGIATFPTEISNTDENSEDFVLVKGGAFSPIPPYDPRSNLSRTFVHEVGHYLFLEHPWGLNGSCTEDDGCPDTPNTASPAIRCSGNPACNRRGLRAMTENYMDYVEDPCYRLFTSCQRGRMRAALAFLRSNLYADDNNALDNPAPAIDMTIYKGFQESRPDALFFNSATGRFRSPKLFVANQGRTAVSSATLVFAINGTEVARFDATNNFGFCDVETVVVPSSVQDRLASTTLDLSRENTLAIWVDAAGENYRANDTLIVTDRAKNASSQTLTISEENISEDTLIARPTGGVTLLSIMLSGATDVVVTGADDWIDIPFALSCEGNCVRCEDGNCTRSGELLLDIRENLTNMERKDTLYFTPTGGVGKTVEDTLYIKQGVALEAARIKVTFTPANLTELPAAGGTFTANIDISGVATDWRVVLPNSSFVTPSASSGTGDGMPTFTYAANPSAASRSVIAIFEPRINSNPVGEAIVRFFAQLGRDATPSTIPSITLGTSVAEASSPIKLFPNPSNGEVFLSVETEKKQEIQVSFFDALGTLAHRQTLEVAPNDHRIALSPKVAGGGLYFVHIKGENLDELKRLVMR